MANNRMFLVHLPTGLAAGLAKRMGWGWYTASSVDQAQIGRRIQRLFDVLEDRGYEDRQDDFAIALEDAEGATLAHGGWQYGEGREDGLTQLVLDENYDAKQSRERWENQPFTWFTQLPTQEGWYWVQMEEGDPAIVWVYRDIGKTLMRRWGQDIVLEEYPLPSDTKWSGPIPEPKV